MSSSVAFGVVVASGSCGIDVDGDGDGRGTAATVRVSAVGVLVDEVGNGLVCTRSWESAVVGVAGVVGGRSASTGGFTGGVASSRPHPATSPTMASIRHRRRPHTRGRADGSRTSTKHGHLPSDDAARTGW